MLKNAINKGIVSHEPFVSLEFHPPKIDELVDFFKTVEYVTECNPLFISISWHIQNNPHDLMVPSSSLTIAQFCNEKFGLEVLLHMCCDGVDRLSTLNNLRRAKRLNLSNILALRGDFSRVTGLQGRYSGLQMVEWCKEVFHEEITVAVSGYPEGHSLSDSYESDLCSVRRKEIAGADFVITQLFFDEKIFVKYFTDCRAIGINIPIFPGIIIFKKYETVLKISKLAKIRIPLWMSKVLEEHKSEEEIIERFSLHLAFTTCHYLLHSGLVPNVHIFTMNQKEQCGLLLRRLGFWLTINTNECKLLKNTWKP